tara:strand:+ start:1479 stop:2204 length:726 start_codon:yes stop_codon:yes gene_type:complete
MHSSAIYNLEIFLKVYLKKFDNPTILDFGGASVFGKSEVLNILNKSNFKFKYLSVDVEKNENVNIVIKDPYKINEIDVESIDIVICTSVFEHIDFFWLSFLEILKILKPRGIFYLNVPSNGNFHRYPADCWRFYPDSGKALAKWANHNKFKSICLESYISKQILECGWNDFVSIILKDDKFLNDFDKTIISNHKDYFNGIDKEGNLTNFLYRSEDQNNWGYRLWYKLRKKRDKKKFKNLLK